MLADGTFDFKLRKSIEVAGCNDPVTTLTFHECGEGYDSYYMKLRKFTSKAQMNAASLMKQLGDVQDIVKMMKDENKESSLTAGKELKPLHQKNENEHEIETKQFADLLKMSLGNSDDLEELVKVFGFMVSNSGNDAICNADGVRVKEGAWKRLHIEDKIDAAVQYCSFFGIGSDQASKNTSEAASESPTEVKAL